MAQRRTGRSVNTSVSATAVADPVIGIMIRTRIGLNLYGTNTELERLKVGPFAAGDIRELTFAFRCELCPDADSGVAGPGRGMARLAGRRGIFRGERRPLHGWSGESAGYSKREERVSGHCWSLRPGRGDWFTENSRASRNPRRRPAEIPEDPAISTTRHTTHRRTGHHPPDREDSRPGALDSAPLPQ